MAEARAGLLAEVLQDQLVACAEAEIRPLRVWLGINAALRFALGGGLVLVSSGQLTIDNAGDALTIDGDVDGGDLKTLRAAQLPRRRP